ncbi:hypothetical protein Nepgr_017323 [Nepenthes gracilis]|uniref:Uncharacterized protein n=1 Tax=Nepenthes gracilis TaxID=150966 RepID=A0AAD3SS66_NEPGR|nr:hypothetical protein Nepgr_017323 [Nepenthes gracilis]
MSFKNRVENGASNGSLEYLETSSLDNDDVRGTDGELNPLDDRTRDLGPLESKTQVDLESSTDLEVPQESKCVHLEAHEGEMLRIDDTNQESHMRVFEDLHSAQKVEVDERDNVIKGDSSKTFQMESGRAAEPKFPIANSPTAQMLFVENGHHEPTDRSQVEEPPTPHKLEELNGAEEDRIPDTPTSMDSLNHLAQEASPHGKKGIGNRRIGGWEYPKREEERNAAAIAPKSETMAMINSVSRGEDNYANGRFALPEDDGRTS